MSQEKNYTQALQPGTMLNGGEHPYKVVRVLGQGGFGITYLVSGRLRVGTINVTVQFAVKEFFVKACCFRDEDGTTMLCTPGMLNEVTADLKAFVNEGKRLQQVCQLSPHIVNVNEVFEANGTAYYVMEYLDGGDLRTLIRGRGNPLNEEEMMTILRPVANAVQILHKHKMLHLDIKPENIVMRSGAGEQGERVPVLIDFGISIHFDRRGNPTTKSTGQGTSRGYSPMEQYAAINRFAPALDIYALSATCYYMLTGRDPAMAFDIKPGEIASDLRECGVSEPVMQAVAHGMAPLSHDRPATVEALLEQFETALTARASQPTSATQVSLQQQDQSKPQNEETVDSNPTLRLSQVEGNSRVDTAGLWPKLKRPLILAGSVLVVAVVAFSVARMMSHSTHSDSTPATDSLTAQVENEPPAPHTITVTDITVHDYPNQATWGDYTYSGEVMSDKPNIPNGKGKGVYNVGSGVTAEYEGSYVNGVREDSAAVYKWSNGDSYTGSFVDDRFGKGTHVRSNGDSYTGTFKDGQYYNGTYRYSTGQTIAYKNGTAGAGAK